MIQTVKRWFQKRKELRATLENAQKEEEREAQKRNDALWEKFREQKFLVHIRGRDGSKNSFETALIMELAARGLTVLPFTDDKGKTIASGDISQLDEGILAIVGVAWFTIKQVGGYPENDGYGNTFYVPATTRQVVSGDYRLIKKIGKEATIVCAGYGNEERIEKSVSRIISELVSAMDRI